MSKQLHEECGLIGIYNVPKASKLTYYALHSLQHRGEEGAGIVSRDGNHFNRVKGLGLLSDVVKPEHLDYLTGRFAVGHVSYGSVLQRGIENVQPLLFKHSSGDFCIAHNGSVINSGAIRKELENEGSIFQSTTDSEIIAHLIKKNKNEDRVEALKQALNKLDGGFAFLIMTEHGLYAARDRHGLRPLCLGSLKDGYVFASESCAFDIIGATYIRDVQAGEIVYIRDNIVNSYRFAESSSKICSMEFIYFARPDSTIDGQSVYFARKKAGEALYKECPIEADMVVGIPDSSLPAAAGYAEASKIPFELALLKNKYVGRTFIQPTQDLRERGVLMKLSVIAPLVKGKRIVLVDDSIVRGTTSRRIVTMLKEAGAKEVHVRIASPAFRHPCYYGVDTKSYDELISHKSSVDEVRDIIGADSLYFLSEQGLINAVGIQSTCISCFSGNYPTKLYNNKVLAPKWKKGE